MSEKRKTSILIPYKKDGDTLLVYMQKRSDTAKRLPGYFGFWGGGVEEGETFESGLQREIKEEMGLDLSMESVSFFNHYEFLKSIKNIFILEVPEGWEDIILIGEGDFGKWFNLDEVVDVKNMILEDKVVLNDLERVLLNNPIK